MKSSTVIAATPVEDAAERARVEEIFARFDTNKSGVLEKEQGKAFLQVELEHMTGAEPTDDDLVFLNLRETLPLSMKTQVEHSIRRKCSNS